MEHTIFAEQEHSFKNPSGPYNMVVRQAEKASFSFFALNATAMHHHQTMHQHQHQQRTSTGICLEMAAFSDVGAICSEASCRRQVRAAVKQCLMLVW